MGNAEGAGSQDPGLENDRARFDAEMEALDKGEGAARRVNISVSHASLTDNLRPLKGTQLSLRTQAQGGNGGPRKASKKILRNLTINSRAGRQLRRHHDPS